jgi:hypothetical protein
MTTVGSAGHRYTQQDVVDAVTHLNDTYGEIIPKLFVNRPSDGRTRYEFRFTGGGILCVMGARSAYDVVIAARMGTESARVLRRESENLPEAASEGEQP